MDEQVFADGIGTISMIGGTVRVDFLSYSPTDMDAAGQPRAVFRQRVIMGLEAFINAAEKIHEAAQALAARTPRPEIVTAPQVQSIAPPPTVVPPLQEQRAATAPSKPPFP